MYQSIYRFAKECGLEYIKNRVYRKVAAHIVLDKNGELIRIEKALDEDKKAGVLCPDIGGLQYPPKSTTNANPICEKMFTILYGAQNKKANERTIIGDPIKHNSWLLIMKDGAENVEALRPVYAFIQHMEQDPDFRQNVYDECVKQGIKEKDFISFRNEFYNLESDPSWGGWFDKWMIEHTDQNPQTLAISCISGNEIEPWAKAFSQIRTSQTGTGAYIASFGSDALCSYGIDDNRGTPMSEEEAETIRTGIEYLLKSENNHNEQFGIIYWYEKPVENDYITQFLRNTTKENKVAAKKDVAYTELMAYPVTKDGTKRITSLYGDSRYHIMSYAVPSKGRFFVRNEHTGSYGDMLQHITEWERDTALELKNVYSGEDGKKVFTGITVTSLHNIYGIMIPLLKNAQAKNKAQQVEKEFGLIREALLYAVLEGIQIPRDVFYRAVENITKVRLGTTASGANMSLQIIKAYLLRTRKEEYKNMDTMLNESVTSKAYAMGRFLAHVAQTQREALGRVDSSITSKYYAGAKANPGRVFPVLCDMSNIYLNKLRNTPKLYTKANIRIVEKGEILSTLGELIPTKFSLEEQGAFDLGFAHQDMIYAKEFLARKSTMRNIHSLDGSSEDDLTEVFEIEGNE